MLVFELLRYFSSIITITYSLLKTYIQWFFDITHLRTFFDLEHFERFGNYGSFEEDCDLFILTFEVIILGSFLYTFYLTSTTIIYDYYYIFKNYDHLSHKHSLSKTIIINHVKTNPSSIIRAHKYN